MKIRTLKATGGHGCVWLPAGLILSVDRVHENATWCWLPDGRHVLVWNIERDTADYLGAWVEETCPTCNTRWAYDGEHDRLCPFCDEPDWKRLASTSPETTNMNTLSCCERDLCKCDCINKGGDCTCRCGGGIHQQAELETLRKILDSKPGQSMLCDWGACWDKAVDVRWRVSQDVPGWVPVCISHCRHEWDPDHEDIAKASKFVDTFFKHTGHTTHAPSVVAAAYANYLIEQLAQESDRLPEPLTEEARMWCSACGGGIGGAHNGTVCPTDGHCDPAQDIDNDRAWPGVRCPSCGHNVFRTIDPLDGQERVDCKKCGQTLNVRNN